MRQKVLTVFVLVLGWVAALLQSCVAVPQVLRLFANRTTDGVSVTAWRLILAGNLSWTLHGVWTGHANVWLPNLIFAQGYPMVKSFEYTLIITLAQLPGYAVAAYLIERWGRRPTLATFLIGSAAGASLFGNAQGPTALLLTGSLLSFFNLGAWGALYAISPEIYPTSIRGTGSGAAAAFGRIASILAPLSVPFLKDAGGIGLVFAVLGTAFAIGAAAAFALPDQRGRALEE